MPTEIKYYILQFLNCDSNSILNLRLCSKEFNYIINDQIMKYQIQDMIEHNIWIKVKLELDNYNNIYYRDNYIHNKLGKEYHKLLQDDTVIQYIINGWNKDKIKKVIMLICRYNKIFMLKRLALRICREHLLKYIRECINNKSYECYNYLMNINGNDNLLEVIIMWAKVDIVVMELLVRIKDTKDLNILFLSLATDGYMKIIYDIIGELMDVWGEELGWIDDNTKVELYNYGIKYSFFHICELFADMREYMNMQLVRCAYYSNNVIEVHDYVKSADYYINAFIGACEGGQTELVKELAPYIKDPIYIDSSFWSFYSLSDVLSLHQLYDNGKIDKLSIMEYYVHHDDIDNFIKLYNKDDFSNVLYRKTFGNIRVWMQLNTGNSNLVLDYLKEN
ncbi:F-box domain-containing protein [Orpheovirus IHUMI-LCC2]|uniref:F-box domain-containing protein n=1 Tax=Orpheovirus IHUMI-LCC2 TaxID=2023057 RepID=A0A2I2L558_9VIRU|nr:F-box domain-containing protein [Orpheovirus IHUMI-LCC2]SNW62640.1 F-box domain-containing protein [Orpheovirus IHUMI-LCC2]